MADTLLKEELDILTFFKNTVSIIHIRWQEIFMCSREKKNYFLVVQPGAH